MRRGVLPGTAVRGVSLQDFAPIAPASVDRGLIEGMVIAYNAGARRVMAEQA